MQTGQGMLATINIAAPSATGYTMTRSGYIYQIRRYVWRKSAAYRPRREGDEILLNQYSVLAINPERCEKAKFDLAMAFSDWMAGKEAQGLIRDFKLLGKPLFVPNAK